MNLKHSFCVGLLILFITMSSYSLPQLESKGNTKQLIINNNPFLMLGVEATNKLLEDTTDLEYLDENLDMYQRAGVNTVLIPIAWYSFEPHEDFYDYTMIDALIEGCRERNLKLIVLWFGAIKNGGLHFAPDWFKQDRQRFFRAIKPDGSEAYAVSPFCQAAIDADKEAFVLLMKRIKEKDPNGNVVIMVQPENETGCQGIDHSREFSDAADTAWKSNVPQEFMDSILANEPVLHPWLKELWIENGQQTGGTWPEVFGEQEPGQKVFMAYYMARFVEQVAQAGKEVHPLPMFANDWLGSLNEPGGPVGGPDFQVMDVWMHAAPSLDLFAPDIYKNQFKEWCAAFRHRDNPLLIPEAHGTGGRSAAQCWYAIAQHDAMLYAPYLHIGDEYFPDHRKSREYFEKNHLDRSYPLLANMSQVILEKQGKEPREMIAFLMDKGEDRSITYQETIQGFTVLAQPLSPFPSDEEEDKMIPPFAVVIQMEENNFVVIGTKMYLQFSKPGLLGSSARLGQFYANEWRNGRKIQLNNLMEERVVEFNLTTDPLDIQQMRIRMGVR